MIFPVNAFTITMWQVNRFHGCYAAFPMTNVIPKPSIINAAPDKNPEMKFGDVDHCIPLFHQVWKSDSRCSVLFSKTAEATVRLPQLNIEKKQLLNVRP